MGFSSSITACTLDCPDACSLVVSKGPDGKVRIRGNPEHPVTQGFACPKMRTHLRRLMSADRITQPMLRSKGHWEHLGWDAALDLCAERIQKLRSEPESMLYFHGEGAKGALKQAGHLFFGLLGSSRVSGSLCDAAGFSACRKDFGSNMGSDIKGLEHSRAIVNWGRDVLRSSIHTAYFLRKARKKGARVLTISPGGDLNEGHSDAIIRIRPGTDRLLAASVLRLMMERGSIRPDAMESCYNYGGFSRMLMENSTDELLKGCSVSQEHLELVYSAYARMHPTATIIGAGLQRYAHGGETVRFINALAMLSGNMGREGGGSFFHLSSLKNLDLSWTRRELRQNTRALRMPTIGREMAGALDPPVRMIWVDGTNFVNQAPDAEGTARSFEAVEFKVVVDAFMTDTSTRADLVLPPALMLEQEDVVASYLHDYVHYARPVLEPPGKAMSDFWILSELGRRLDPPILLPDAGFCMEQSLRGPHLHVTLEELKERNYVRAQRPHVAYEGMVFDHEDARYRLPDMLSPEPQAPAHYPLRLLSMIRKRTMHSQIPETDQEMPPKVWVASLCEALKNIETDKDCYLVSPLGRMPVRVEILEGLHPQAVLYRRGDWMMKGGGVNRIIEPRLTDMGTGAAFYEQYVRIEND